MAKTSKRVAQLRKPKFKVRAYSSCSRCGRPHRVYCKFGVCCIGLLQIA